MRISEEWTRGKIASGIRRIRRLGGKSPLRSLLVERPNIGWLFGRLHRSGDKGETQ